MFPPVREPPVKRTYKKREPKVRPPPVPEEPLPAKRSRGLSSAAAAALKNPTNTWGTALRSAPGAGGGGGAPATWAGGQRGPGGWGGYRPPPLPKLPPIMTMPQNFQAADAVRLRNLREALDVFREEARETHQTRLAAMEDAREALRDARGLRRSCGADAPHSAEGPPPPRPPAPDTEDTTASSCIIRTRV